jgi:hypothetical protein
MRWTLWVRKTSAPQGGRRSRSVLIPRRWYQVLKKLTLLGDDGDNKARSPGRLRRKLLKPSRRECRNVRLTCGDYACVLFSLAHKAAGAVKRPAFPAPSCRLRDNDHAKLGHHVPRERESSSAKNPSFTGDAEASNPESMARSGHEEKWIPPTLQAPRIDTCLDRFARASRCRPRRRMVSPASAAVAQDRHLRGAGEQEYWIIRVREW